MRWQQAFQSMAKALDVLDDLKPTHECNHPWALVEISWTSQQLGADCRYIYDAIWLCLDPYGVTTEQKSEDRPGTCLTFG